jgi:hypothetical protein
MRARTFWFLTLPALFVAETTAHTLMARALDPANERHGLTSRVLEAYAPQLLAVSLLLAAAILGRRVLASFRAEGPQPLPGWRLAAIPAVGFLLQEHLERLLQDDQVGWLTTLEPAVLIGLGLQVPFGLFAIWLVRTLLRAAEQLGWTLARRGASLARRAGWVGAGPRNVPPPRLSVLASRHAGRAPPLRA